MGALVHAHTPSCRLQPATQIKPATRPIRIRAQSAYASNTRRLEPLRFAPLGAKLALLVDEGHDH
eukprot:15253792-Alexandrium_andersonii.AAC.1